MSTGQTIFTLQEKFLHPTAFYPQIDVSNPIFQSVNNKRAHGETYKRFLDNVRPISTNISFLKIESFHFFFISFILSLDTFTNKWFAEKLRSSETMVFFCTNANSRQTVELDCRISSDSAQIYPNCIPTRYSQPYPHCHKSVMIH